MESADGKPERAPSPAALAMASTIARAMCADRVALEQRFGALREVSHSDPRWAALRADAERSAALAAERLSALPKPALDQRLPILERRADIEAAIRAHQVVVICGETGSGKTTQLAQICLSLGRGARGMIAHTQPRRLAARAVGARIAEELRVQLGSAVGVKVRFNDQTSSRTVLKLMTDGMLLAETASDPDLSAYDTIIIDEAHERSLNIDFLLGYLRRLLPRRPDLKLIITSATIDPARFANHFALPGSPPPPVIEVSGRTFPVDVRYHPTDDPTTLDPRAIADAVEELTIVRGGDGSGNDILVFLPGEREIRECERVLRAARVDAEILPVYSRLSNAEQDRIFHASVRRRVLLATNVAETSLTIPGIRCVVDTGLARISRYDAKARVQRLPIEPISRASAAQRSGRCGRVAAGVCIRLYSERSFAERPAFTEPEIRRTNLAGVILQMKALNLGPISEFPFLDPPDAQAIREGYETLFEIGALESKQPGAAITPLGLRLARVPAEPRIARMLLAGAQEGSLAETLVLAAALSIQDPRDRPSSAADAADRAHLLYRHESSDFLTLLNIWNDYRHAADELTSGELRDWCRQRFLNPLRMREWGETYWQLRSIAEDLDLELNARPAHEDAVHRALIPGLIPHLCCKEDASSYEYRAARGNVVSIFPGSVLFKKNPKWFVAAELVETTRLYARTIAKIDPAWIEQLAAHVLTRTVNDEHFDVDTGAPSAWERLTLNGLVVVPRRRVPLAGADPAAARRLFIRKHLLTPDPSSAHTVDAHNAQQLALARQAEGKLRRRGCAQGVRTPDDELIAWFESRLPTHVHDREAFVHWSTSAPAEAARLLLTPDVTLTPSARAELSPDRYPDWMTISAEHDATRLPLQYAFEPGQESDGITVHIPLLSLEALSQERIDWLVPGFLESKVHALLKQLPKQHRAQIEARMPLAECAAQCTQVLAFGAGSLAASLSEAVHVLADVDVPTGSWPLAAVPDHLRLRIAVEDKGGKQVGVSRDLEALRQQLASRIRKARAADAVARFQRTGVTTWDFPELPDAIEIDTPGGHLTAFPTIVDAGTSVSITLAATREQRLALTPRGVRRLLALACRDELAHRIDALPQWDDLKRWYAQLGTPDELRDHLACIIVERTFLTAQSAPTNRLQFDERLQGGWGRLAQSTFEVADVVARTLEPRSRVAQRLSGGTPRLWAASIADIREHAAYLMPRGFLNVVPWERLREYPRYAVAMRERLLRLREDGSGSESSALAQIQPHWKKFTAHVAKAMADRKSSESAQFIVLTGPQQSGSTKAALPQTRRQSPAVNTDAGEWSLQPGSLSPALMTFRWALEEARSLVFSDAPGDAAKATKALAELGRLSVLT